MNSTRSNHMSQHQVRYYDLQLRFEFLLVIRLKSFIYFSQILEQSASYFLKLDTGSFGIESRNGKIAVHCARRKG